MDYLQSALAIPQHQICQRELCRRLLASVCRAGRHSNKPLAYPSRTPHIHFAVSGAGLERMTTQMYLAGEPMNERDFVFRRSEIEAGALSGTFDIVLGRNLLKT